MPLFDRTGRRLVPNAAGRRTLVAAHQVLDELRSATHAATGMVWSTGTSSPPT